MTINDTGIILVNGKRADSEEITRNRFNRTLKNFHLYSSITLKMIVVELKEMDGVNRRRLSEENDGGNRRL